MNFPKTPGQCKYMRMLQSSKPIIVATGPAGTGKTMLACQLATENLINRDINRLVLTRPIVGADEDMGYLPGEMERKMEPWTRPMIDVFENYLTRGQLEHHVHIEPLGFMRGRTFDNAYIIADEMQNSTPNQMKMLLTRLGTGSKMAVTGDLAQADRLRDNGLIDFCRHLENKGTTERLTVIEFQRGDIERHEAVKEVLEIYGDVY